MASSTSFMVIILLLLGHEVLRSEGNLAGVKSLMGSASIAIKIGTEVYNGVDYLYKSSLPTTTKESESDQKMIPGMEQRMTDQIKQVSKYFHSLKMDIQNVREQIIERIATEISDQVILRSNLYEIYLRINQIENSYESFLAYISEPHKYSNYTLKQFAKAATSPELTELPNVLKTIHWLLVQKDFNLGESILTVLSRSTQIPSQMCKTKQSLQQLLYHLHSTIEATEIKGYAMILYGHLILQNMTGENQTNEILEATEKFEHRITITAQNVAKAMKSASRVIWTCDDNHNIEDETYTKLNNVFQKYIINEVDLNPEGTCTKTCSKYVKAKAYGCFDEKICAHQRTCNGQLWECEYKISSAMYICPSYDKKSNRRYNYVEYGNSQRYGLEGRCPNPAVELDSWGRGFSHCSYCLCTCDDIAYSDSDRYINLRPVVAKIFNNYVVTGVRFRKSKNMIHIQIQEGVLLPGAKINESTVSWKPIESYKIREPMPGSEGQTWEYYPIEELDYHVLQWKIQRQMFKDDKYLYRKAAIDLDDLDFADLGPSNYTNYVVTGLQFVVNEVLGSGYHVGLQVQMSPFNFTSGQLLLWNEKYPWMSPYKNLSGAMFSANKYEKSEIKLDDLDVPTKSNKSPAIPTSQTNQFLYLTTSSLETDAGQNTLPFIDLKPVETYPPTPLSGAGLFHKSSPGSGGFLSMKLFTYDYSKRVENFD